MSKKPTYPQQEMADRLRDALEAARVRQVELARACGVTEQSVHDWLKTGRVGKQHFAAICALTGKDFSYFLVGLKTWRRPAAIALTSLLPLAVTSFLDSSAMCLGCVLCKIRGVFQTFTNYSTA